MPESQQLPLSGPTFSRALSLARQAVIDAILGGPGVDAGLEPVLTEAINDRLLGSVLSFLLIGFASQAAVTAAVAELDDGNDAEPDDETIANRAVELVSELAEAFKAIAPTEA